MRHIDVESAERDLVHVALDQRRSMRHTLFEVAVVYSFSARLPFFVLLISKLQHVVQAAGELPQMGSLQ
jgi:hypothetical protein